MTTAEPMPLTVLMMPCEAGHVPKREKQIDYQLKVRSCWTCGRAIEFRRMPKEDKA